MGGKTRVKKKKAENFLAKMILFLISIIFLKVRLILLLCAVNTWYGIRQRKGNKAFFFSEKKTKIKVASIQNKNSYFVSVEDKKLEMRKERG